MGVGEEKGQSGGGASAALQIGRWAEVEMAGGKKGEKMREEIIVLKIYLEKKKFKWKVGTHSWKKKQIPLYC